MNQPSNSHEKGRGAQIRPPNRFDRIHVEPDLEQVDFADEEDSPVRSIRTEFLADNSRSIVSENDSPDVGFRYSVNPYRGCEHGCAYCYARPSHEYLGLDAGIDFESKILVKQQAPELLRDWLARPEWKPETIVFSGVTDCYQPAERIFKLTRGCLEVALEARQPVSIITKNALVLRDIELLKSMTEFNIVRVAISVTTLNEELARTMEPRTSPPSGRLRAISELSQAGVPVQSMVAPIIPGLNDSEIPAILRAVKDAGALGVGFTLLRLPLAVRPVFLDWLSRTQPSHEERVVSRIKSTRGGKLNDPSFGGRMKGEGAIAEQIRNTFKVFKAKYGLDQTLPPLSTEHFRPPRASTGQLSLF